MRRSLSDPDTDALSLLIAAVAAFVLIAIYVSVAR